jgi:lipopolysaccharide export system protein LptA
LTAEKVVVTEDATGHKFCVATGQLASFRQKRDGANEYVEGFGERIEYNTLSEKIDLFVRARVKQDQDDVRGDHITYSTQTEIFRVSSPENNGRVRATLQPKNKDAKNPEPLIVPKSSEPTPVELKATDPKFSDPKIFGPAASAPSPAGK